MGAFRDVYHELESLDSVHGLDVRSLHVSVDQGLEWVSPPDYHALDLTEKQLLDIYYYMVLMRQVDEEHTKLCYANLAFGKHLPAIGNEATAIGAAYALNAEDWLTFAIRDMGAFCVRGMPLDQIFGQAMGRECGPTKGWDGIMHMGDKALRAVGLISHLGTMIPVAVGCAFGEKYQGKDGVALAFSGEGAMSTGDVHEGLNIASVLRVPLVVVVENNQWGFGTPTKLQYAVPALPLRAFAYGPDVEGYLIDGTNVVTVYGTVKKALEKIRRQGKGTVIVETRSMRMKGHSIADPFTTYVPDEQLKLWGEKDPIATFERFLRQEGLAGDVEFHGIKERVQSEIREAVHRASQSPLPDGKDITRVVFTPPPTHPVELREPPAEGKHMTYHAAIRGALMEEMDRDPNLFIIGEDIGVSHGAFKITEGFSERYDGIRWEDWWKKKEVPVQRRIIDAPIAESGFCGVACGAVLAGLRVIVEFQYADFASEAFKMLVNYLATQTVRGMGPAPIVFRMPSGWAPSTSLYHSVNPETWFASTPGLKIVAPITAFDAKGLLKAAIRDNNPVLFLEYKGYYRIPPDKLPSVMNLPVPEEDYIVPIGKGRVVKAGEDLSVVTYGSQVFRVVEAVRMVEKETGRSIEIIDLRSIIPWDQELVSASVEKTGRALVTCEAPLTGSFGNIVARHIGEKHFGNLDAPPTLVAAADTPAVPFSQPLEDAHLPTAKKVAEAIRQLLAY